MKVYTHIVMDMTQEGVPVVEEKSYSYEGQVSLCSGGGGGGYEGAPDFYYERKMDVAESQQGIADEAWNLYKHGQAGDVAEQTQYKIGDQWMGADEAKQTLGGGGPDSLNELETKEVETNRGRGSPGLTSGQTETKYKVGDTWLSKDDAKTAIASNTGDVDLTDYSSRIVTNDSGNLSKLDVEKNKLEATNELIDPMTENMKGKLDFAEDQREFKREGMGLKSEMIDKKQSILDDMGSLGINSRMNQAEADVTQQFNQNQEEARRSMSRMGIDPTSGKFQDMQEEMAIEKAGAEAGARNQARTKSKQLGFGLMGG